METSWLSTVLNMLKDIPHWDPMVERSCQGCFRRPAAKGSGIIINPFGAQRYVSHRQGFSFSVCLVVVGVT